MDKRLGGLFLDSRVRAAGCGVCRRCADTVQQARLLPPPPSLPQRIEHVQMTLIFMGQAVIASPMSRASGWVRRRICSNWLVSRSVLSVHDKLTIWEQCD
jgi:hypothetical protein